MPQPLNILFDARVLHPHYPGIGRFAANLMRALTQRDDVRITALRNADTNAFESETITWHNTSVKIFSPQNLAALEPIFSRADFDIAHFPYYVRPFRTRARSVTIVHDVIPFVYPQLVDSARTRLLIRFFHKIALRASTRVMTDSQASADDIARIFPQAQKKSTVIPGAPDPIFIPQSVENQTRAKEKYQLPPTFALYLASNKPHKNLVRLIEAWKVYQESASSPMSLAPTLIIAGFQDPRYTHAQDRARELGLSDNVQFIGAVPDADMASLYSACTVFVYPSLYEGFGLTPLEAMACGAPVICSNTSSLPEVVGDAAIPIDPLDVNSIASAMSRVMHDGTLRAQLRACSLSQATRFTWARAAQQTVELYQAALNK